MQPHWRHFRLLITDRYKLGRDRALDRQAAIRGRRDALTGPAALIREGRILKVEQLVQVRARALALRVRRRLLRLRYILQPNTRLIALDLLSVRHGRRID